MEPRDIVLLALEGLGGRVSGKTKLQKLVYFVGLLSDHDGSLDYDAHFYGPYSATVDEAVLELVGLGYVDTTTRHTGEIGQGGFEKVFYTYELTGDGRTLAGMLASRLGEHADRVTRAAERLKPFKELHYMRLAAAAKVIFLARRAREPLNKRSARARAREAGWDLTDDAVLDAVNTLESLGLLRVTRTPAAVH